MRRFLKFLSLCFCVVGSCLLFSACSTGGGNDNNGKPKLKADMVNISGEVCYYDYGNPVTIPEENFRIWVPGHGYGNINDFTLAYENNVNVDDNSCVTLTAKSTTDYVYGSVKIPFNIYPIDRELTDPDDFNELYYSNNTRRLLIKCDLNVGEGEVLSFDRTTDYYDDDFYVLFGNSETALNLVNNGTINLSKAFLVEAQAEIVNNGTININQSGELRLYAGGKVLDKGTINNLGRINCYGAIYTHDQNISGNVSTGGYGGGSIYVRQPFTSDRFTLAYDTTEYRQNTNSYTPAVTMGGLASDRTIEYINNTSAGTASVRVSVSEYNTAYYGAPATKTFTITKGYARINNFDSLVSAQNSGNYDRYIISSNFIFPADSTFTLGADETLTIQNNASSISFHSSSSFTNNGTIVVNTNCTTTLYLSGNFANNGTFTIQKRSTTYKRNVFAGKVFTNGSENNHTASFECDRLISSLNDSSFDNYGSITTLAGAQFSCNYTNHQGAIHTFSNSASFSQNFINHGTITFTTNYTATFGNSFVNDGTITLPANFTATFTKMSFENSGTINSDSDIVFYDNFVGFENNGTFQNNGHIWTYETLENVSGNITLKKRLSTLTLVLQYSQVDYDTLAKHPTFTIIDGAEEVEATGTGYGMTYTYVAWNSSRTETDTNKSYCKYPGTITATLTIDEGKYVYGGTYSANYTINRSVYSTSNSFLLLDKLQDKDYAGYELSGNVSVSNSSSRTYNIASNQTFDNKGFRFEIANNVTLTNNGSMTLSSTLSPTTLDDCALVLSSSGAFENNGTLENDGIIYLTTPTNAFTSTGTITNNGNMFVFENITTSGTGHVYKRKYLETLKNNLGLELEYSTTLYDETDKTPAPVVYVGNTDGLNTTYTNNHNPSTENNPATATITADVFSQVYAGSTTIAFTIERGIKILDFTEEYRDANNNLFYDENYAIYRLGRNIAVKGYALADLPENTILDLADYEFDNVGYYGHITIPTSSHIHINVDSAERWEYADGFADQITITADIGNPSETLNYYYNSQWTTKEHRAYFRWDSIFTTATIDLNGHTIDGQLKVFTSYQNKNFTFVVNDSSNEKTGSLGSSSNSVYGLYIDSNNDRKLNVVLNEIRVVGCYIKYIGTPSNSNLVANGCAFTTRVDYAIYCGSNVTLTNCSLQGSTAMFVESKGDITLTNCSIYSNGTFSQTTYKRPGQGCAIVYYAYYGDRADLIINNCRIRSTDGHGIEYVYNKNTSGEPFHGYIVVDSATTYNLSSGKSRIFDSAI